MSFKDKWDQLDPRYKRYSVIGLVALVVIVSISLTTGPSETSQKMTKNELVKHVLTDRDTRNVGLDALAADLKALRNETRTTNRQVEKISQEVELTKKKSGEIPAPFRTRIEQMNSDIDSIKSMLEEMKKDQPERSQKGSVSRAEGGLVSHEQRQESETLFSQRDSGLRALDPNDPLAVFRDQKWGTSVVSNDSSSGSNIEGSGSLSLISVVEDIPELNEEEKKKDSGFFLPAASIITGTLINGMDAPTGNGAQKDPFPSLLRIQKEAILPNRFRADIRECFLIIAGYGDLSSERAYLRGETISCVREDGGIIESSLDSYAVGEDGKAGVRGRLVSKQGQIIAKSLMAGFLSGVSKAFDVKPVPVLDTSGSGNMARNRADGNWLQSSAVSGASTALDRIAQFYLDMAEGMFPVIEIDAGRQIDVIVKRGTRLDVRGTGTGGK